MKVKIPNLTSKKIKCVIVDSNAPKTLFDFLDKKEIKYIKTTYLKNCVDAVSTHPDMQICHMGGNLYVCEPTLYEYYCDRLSKYNIVLMKGKKEISSTYPDDIAYNVAITDNFLIHNINYTDKVIYNLIESTDISIYNVKQGYTKCATCIIENNAVITSDRGIYKVCIENSVDCLLVDADSIKLGDRFDGFIGGCCGMIDDKTLLFCGDISAHKSYNEIMKFTSKYNVEVISSSKEMLTDIGSIIPVIQE